MGRKTKPRGRHMHHCIWRARHRYRVTLTKTNWAELSQQIRIGNAKLITRTSPTTTVWAVYHKGVKMIAIYSEEQEVIVTFLPRQWYDKFEHKQARKATT